MTSDDLEKELADTSRKFRDLSGSGWQYIRASRRRRTVLRIVSKYRELTRYEKGILADERFDIELLAEAKKQGEAF